MNLFWKRVRRVNAALIPYSLIILAGIIIYDLFFHVDDPRVNTVVAIFDGLVIANFAIDLVFLYLRVRKFSVFLKNYWLDIIAIFPFYFFFRFFGQFYRTVIGAEEVLIGQRILHESLEAEKEVAAAIKAERGTKILRSGIRTVRILTKTHFLSDSEKYLPNLKRRGRRL